MSLDQRGYDPVARGKYYLFTALLPDWLRDFQVTNQHAFHNKQSRREIPLVVLTIELPARRQFADHYIKMYFFPFKTSKQAWQPPKTFILKTKLYSCVGCRLLTRKCHRTFFQAFFARLAARLYVAIHSQKCVSCSKSVASFCRQADIRMRSHRLLRLEDNKSPASCQQACCKLIIGTLSTSLMQVVSTTYILFSSSTVNRC